MQAGRIFFSASKAIIVICHQIASLFKVPAENIFDFDFKAVQNVHGHFKFNFGAFLVGQFVQFVFRPILVDIIEKIFAVAQEINLNTFVPWVDNPIFADAIAFVDVFFDSEVAFHRRTGKNFCNHIGHAVQCRIFALKKRFCLLRADKNKIGLKKAAVGEMNVEIVRHNYSELVSAEQRIKSLDSDKADDKQDEKDEKKESKGGLAILVISIAVGVLVVAGLAGAFLYNKKNKATKKEADTSNENNEE